MKQLQQKIVEQNKAVMKENAKVLDRRLAEQRKLLEEGFQEKAQAMRDEVQQLQRQQEAYLRAMENANQGRDVLDFLSRILGGLVRLQAK